MVCFMNIYNQIFGIIAIKFGRSSLWIVIQLYCNKIWRVFFSLIMRVCSMSIHNEIYYNKSVLYCGYRECAVGITTVSIIAINLETVFMSYVFICTTLSNNTYMLQQPHREILNVGQSISLYITSSSAS